MAFINSKERGNTRGRVPGFAKLRGKTQGLVKMVLWVKCSMSSDPWHKCWVWQYTSVILVLGVG